MSRIAVFLALALSTLWIGMVSAALPFVGGPYQGLDWIEVFDPATRLVATGSVPYGVVPAASHPIHLYLLIAFTSYVSPADSYPLWVAASLGIVAWAMWLLAGGTWQSTLAIMASPFLALVVLLGEVTAIEVLGLALLFLALERRGLLLIPALLILSAVPPNTILVAAWAAWRLYRRNKWLALSVIATCTLAISATLLMFGNWLTPYLYVPAESWEANEAINLSLWVYSSSLGLIVLALAGIVSYLAWNRLLAAPTKLQLLYVLATSCLITPYLLGHRLLPLYILLCAHLAEQDRRLPVLLLFVAYGLFWASLYVAPQFLYLIVLVAWSTAIASLHRIEDLQWVSWV